MGGDLYVTFRIILKGVILFMRNFYCLNFMDEGKHFSVYGYALFRQTGFI